MAVLLVVMLAKFLATSRATVFAKLLAAIVDVFRLVPRAVLPVFNALQNLVWSVVLIEFSAEGTD